MYQYLDDAASFSVSSTNYEDEEEEDEFNELADLSKDNFEWGAGDVVDHVSTLSYDSRYESGNEGYEHNGFVVGDDDVEEFTDSEVDEPGRVDPGAAIHHSSITGCTHRSSSTDSRLFVSDPSDTYDPLAVLSWFDLGFVPGSPQQQNTPLMTEASSEVVEEILDALVLFSRRCHRDRAPVRLKLASVVLKDEEVKEALEEAVRLGLGRKVSLEDGSKCWTIGPKAR